MVAPIIANAVIHLTGVKGFHDLKVFVQLDDFASVAQRAIVMTAVKGHLIDFFAASERYRNTALGLRHKIPPLWFVRFGFCLDLLYVFAPSADISTGKRT